MIVKKRLFLTSFLFVTVICFGSNLTIEEKLAKLGNSSQANSTEQQEKISSSILLKKMATTRNELKEKYEISVKLREEEAADEEYLDLLEEINILKQELDLLEKQWRCVQTDEIQRDSEGYGIWEHDEITVSDLVMEYGSTDYLYIFPPDIGAIKLNVHSALMIPRDSWSYLLETIFKHNGIGVREINPYTRQLFTLKQDNISSTTILTQKEHLQLFDRRERVTFIYSPPVAHLKQAYYFVERFRDIKSTFVYNVGAKIAIVGFQEDINRLITLCENVWEKGEQKTVRVVSSSKLQSDDIVKILKSFFGTLSDPSRSIITLKSGHDLSAMPISQDGGVVLVGSKSLVEKAVAIIKETESQVIDPQELTVFWHTCSHSNPADLSEILERVYTSLMHSTMDYTMEPEGPVRDPMYSSRLDDFDDDDDDDDDDDFPSNYERVKPWSTRPRKTKPDRSRSDDQCDEKLKPANFIPYPATGKLLMIVRKDMVSKIKEVIKKLDVAKRMVEIEVLLVERRLKNNSRSGINILRIGSTADNVNRLGAEYHGDGVKASKGLFEFIYSGVKNANFPAVDLSYNFLLSQEDIRVTSAPSVITTNQSQAIIAVTDQISINNGASPVETNKGFVFKDSFERADFGITIKLTPTIHEPEIGDPDEQVFVTLESDISFETIKNVDGTHSNKPDVHKRQVKTQVRIADGQTVILGGLKNKSQEDKSEKIPFLGEIPGFGKLFGTNVLTDQSGEMFIFIKPKVIHDPKTDLVLLREEKLRMRPGDMQKYLDKIGESRKKTHDRRFKKSWDLLFGAREDGTVNLG